MVDGAVVGATGEHPEGKRVTVSLSERAEVLLPSTRAAGHGTALANLDAVRVAVNRVYGDLATPITNNDEVAFFPPVTGG
jgi:molybdopterin converting factor small subunit